MATKDALPEIVRLEQQLATVKSESKVWKNKYDIVNKQLVASDKRANFLADIGRPPRERGLAKIKGSGDATAIMICSDWHVEEEVNPKTINGLNTYTLAIASQRINTVFRRFLMMTDVARAMCTIDTCVIALLGDFISGYIHPELVETNLLSPTEATLFVQDHIVNGIRFLRKEGGFKEIIVPTCYGNHGRTTDKRRCASAYANSYEWLMYKTLEKYVKEPGLTWKVENGYHNWLNIQGYDVRFHHGDELKYQGGVGGITIPINKAIAQWNKVQWADYDYFGHLHQYFNVPRWCCNSSLIGYGAYALSIKAEYEVPSQTISVISKKRGKVLNERLFCD